MQTRSATKRAANNINDDATLTESPLATSGQNRQVEPTRPSTKVANQHQKIRSFYRVAKKAQTGDTSQRDILKHPAKDLSGDDSHQSKPSPKRTKRTAARKTPRPAEDLPHGLGKLHSTVKRSSNATILSKTALPPKSDKLGHCDTDTLNKTTETLDQKTTQVVVNTLPTDARDQATASSNRASTRTLRPLINRLQSTQIPEYDATTDLVDNANENTKQEKPESKQATRKSKENPYGLMPGRTPFPDWLRPSADECLEVHRLLTESHGEFKPPDKIPPPSTSVAGCGEVPDLVDALIRTLISGHTTMKNANLAIQDVIEKYGQWDKDSIGAGSIDWNKVRLSEEHEIVSAVKRAGLGLTKGKDIKAILEIVHQENQQRIEAYRREMEPEEMIEVIGSQELTQGQKQHQVQKIESGVLTLDHIRGMTSDKAMLELTKFPGIGVKTASCLILFCLQQPSFAVDTHVWRFCKWLKWVPPTASRDDTYMHGEVRIPDLLKYGLHQLFIRHGKECGRCRGGTVEGTADWDNVVCPLEYLLDRFDKRKTKVKPTVTPITSLKDTEAIAEGSGGVTANETEEAAAEGFENDNQKPEDEKQSAITTING